MSSHVAPSRDYSSPSDSTVRRYPIGTLFALRHVIAKESDRLHWRAE